MNDIISRDALTSLFVGESRSRRPNYTCCLFIQYGGELDKADVNPGHKRTSGPLDSHVVWLIRTQFWEERFSSIFGQKSRLCENGIWA